MAAGSTYTPIATQTLGSAVATVTFSSIPSTYTDLVIIVNTGFVDASLDNQFEARFNGDTGSNYSVTSLSGDGSSASSNRQSNNTYAEMFKRISRVSLTSNIILQIQNYSNTTTYKTMLARVNAPDSASFPGTNVNVNLWRSTAAINSIAFANYAGGNTFRIGSTFTLYGIAAA
jgi:hypothetical protein